MTPSQAGDEILRRCTKAAAEAAKGAKPADPAKPPA
jgi:hypothetical protein